MYIVYIIYTHVHGIYICVAHYMLRRYSCIERYYIYMYLLQARSEVSLYADLKFLRRYVKLPRVHISIAVESLIGYCNKYRDFDPMLTPVLPSNPWISGDDMLWEVERSL